MSKRQNHRINRLENRVTQLEKTVQNEEKSKNKFHSYNNNNNKDSNNASRFATTVICVLGWWDFFLIFQCVIPSELSLILITLVTAITIIVPVFYQDKIKSIVIKSTEVWGLILLLILLIIVSIILIVIIYNVKKYYMVSIVYLLNI